MFNLRLVVVILSEIFLFTRCHRLPAAPYNVKLYCRNGRSDTLRSMHPSLCPTSSTSCGYFEFPLPERRFKRNTTSIYECVDSSILLHDYEDYNDGAFNPFYALCDHHPKCSEIKIAELNKQFLTYIVRTHSLTIESFESDKLKFCCSLSHSNLGRLVKSRKNQLAFSSTTPPVTCHKQKCGAGAVGCLHFEETAPSGNLFASHQSYTDFGDDASEEYVDIKPVKLIWDVDDLVDDNFGPVKQEDSESIELVRRRKRKKRTNSHLLEEFGAESKNQTDHNDGYQCVHMHLNDEVYRYCMMIYAQKSSSRCISFDGYKVCCCFVNPYESTCNPHLPATSVDPDSSLQVPTIRPPITSTLESHSSGEEVQTDVIGPTPGSVSDGRTTEFPILSMNQRTRCRTVIMTESRPHSRSKNKPRTRKRIVCDDIRTTTEASGSPSSFYLFNCHIFAIFSLIFRCFLGN